MNGIFENIEQIPVCKIESVDNALELAEKIQSAGLKCMEITFRTTNGGEGFKMIAEAIKTVSLKFPSLLVGAGTVVNKKLAAMAIASGAKFIVSAGFNPQTVKYCLKKKVPVVPGVCTPTEIENAMNYGLNLLKFFPAEMMGGTDMLKAFAGPFSNVKFVATGGINRDNMQKYLELKNVAAVGYSFK